MLIDFQKCFLKPSERSVKTILCMQSNMFGKRDTKAAILSPSTSPVPAWGCHKSTVRQFCATPGGGSRHALASLHHHGNGKTNELGLGLDPKLFASTIAVIVNIYIRYCDTVFPLGWTFSNAVVQGREYRFSQRLKIQNCCVFSISPICSCGKGAFNNG